MRVRGASVAAILALAGRTQAMN
ncbi:protein of unknown function [Agreia sp. COWG]|nr:protein of unknown function [Agreia sp. COWG]